MSNKKNNYGAKVEALTKAVKRLEEIAANHRNTPGDVFLNALAVAGERTLMQPSIQNRRVKAIPTLPFDFTKEEVGEFLRRPYDNERALRMTSEGLKWTVYPYSKILKTAQDIPTFRYYAFAKYAEESDLASPEYKREAVLVDKFNKMLDPCANAHRIAGECALDGKVFYSVRRSVDKSHNRVNYAFMQRLPQDYCTIVGYNNLSKYTVMFDLMYFMQPGTSALDFGDLFLPYLDDFRRIFEPRERDKVVYSSANPTVSFKGRQRDIYPGNVNPEGAGAPELRQENGRWMYWVTLPAHKVWTFEIDDATPAVISPFSGLMLTYSQLADFESAQLSIILNPLIKIFTAEIPFYKPDSATKDDPLMLSPDMMFYYYGIFSKIMAGNDTSGTALYYAAGENVKSHDFPESEHANDIASSFNAYNMGKAGLSGIIPVTDDVKAAQVEASRMIEGRFVTAALYPQFSRMMEYLYRSLNLDHEWNFRMFGDIFSEKTIRENAEKAKSSGDTSAYFILAALDSESLLDKISMARAVGASGFLDTLNVPPTAYTQSGSADGTKKTGRPSRDIEEAIERGIGESAEIGIDYSASSE